MTTATFGNGAYGVARTDAPVRKPGFFRRALDRAIAARMAQVERELARYGHVSRSPSADEARALEPFPSLPFGN